MQIVGRDAKRGREQAKDTPFTMLDANGTRCPLEVVHTFRYLGLEPAVDSQPTHSTRWAKLMAAQLTKAYVTYHEICAVARRIECTTPTTLMRLYTTYCAPKAEYGAQLWAPFITTKQRDALDRMQSAFQMRALLPSATAAMVAPFAFAAGEFGRVPPSMHADELALRYFYHCAKAPPETALRRLFDCRMRAARKRAVGLLRKLAEGQPVMDTTMAARAGLSAQSAGHLRPEMSPNDSGGQSWCWAMRALCARYGLSEVWSGTKELPDDIDQWKATCRKAVREVWANLWRNEMASHERLSGLHHSAVSGSGAPATRRLYPPRPQYYLSVACSTRQGRELLAQWRSGALPLGVLRAELLLEAQMKAEAKARAEAQRLTTSKKLPLTSEAERRSRALDVTAKLVETASLCEHCLRQGKQHKDTRQHFAVDCDVAQYLAFVKIVAAAIHRVGHRLSPESSALCAFGSGTAGNAETKGPDGVPEQHAEPATECDGARMATNFAGSAVEEQLRAATVGFAPWICHDTSLRDERGRVSKHVAKAVAETLTRCFQNLLLVRWNARCRALGYTPVVAFADGDLGRQVMRPTADGKGYAMITAVGGEGEPQSGRDRSFPVAAETGGANDGRSVV